MTRIIEKIRLRNFKRFRDYTIIPNPEINVLVGDNETGKSSILEAIDLVASGSVRRLEAIGLDKLLNVDAVKEFNNGVRNFGNLPDLRIELYLQRKSEDESDFSMNGKNNMDGKVCDGIRLIYEPNPDYQKEIEDVLEASKDYFPYEYYSSRFSTFSDEGYTGYKKKLRTVVIDSDNMKSEYATNDFIHRMYVQYTEDDVKERAMHNSQYRLMRNDYCKKNLAELNKRLSAKNKNYSFGLKSGTAMTLDGDLMIYMGQVSIDSKGTGEQSLIKTNFALNRAGGNIDIILMEEPENHLSPVNLRKLVQSVVETRNNGQLFVTTHNSLISTRLELNNLLIMQISGENRPVSLKDLDADTAKYFQKVPPAGIIEFALSKKVILVEGPSEYMLLSIFYESCTGNTPEADNVNIIDIRGLSFKRYLEIAKLTRCKVAVITDNDGDHKKNCEERYSEFDTFDNIQVFYEDDDSKYTFEVVLSGDNPKLCSDLFGEESQEFMKKNKTEAAYRLLDKLDKGQKIEVPMYIKSAIEWIKE